MELKPGRNEARIVIVDGREAVEIALTQGKTTLIDIADWDTVRGYRWYARRTASGYYAAAQRPGQTKGAPKLLMHVLLTGGDSEHHVDHAERGTLDNRRSLIRRATNSQNQANTRSRGGRSRFKNVNWNARHGKWSAKFMHQRRTIFLGYFDDEEQAAVAVDRAAIEIRGSFAWLNFFYTRPVPIFATHP